MGKSATLLIYPAVLAVLADLPEKVGGLTQDRQQHRHGRLPAYKLISAKIANTAKWFTRARKDRQRVLAELPGGSR